MYVCMYVCMSRVFNPDGSLHFSLISPPIYGERAERAARERALRFRVSFRVLLSRDFSRLPPLAGCVEVTVTIVLFQHHRVYASARKHGSQEP